MSRLEIRQLRKSFEGVDVIKGIDLVVEDREFCVFLGPSGCGKSTTLRLIAGLEEADDGQILLDKDDITDKPVDKRDLAMVFQSYALYPHMTVRENMSFALKLAKMDQRAIDEKVARATKILALEPYLDRKPSALSGGQRQRVAIGRAITREPRVFLFDEPLSNLDAALRAATRLEIARLHTELNATMIYVTHDQVEAMTLADRIAIFSHGRIEQIGKPMALYHKPVNKFVAGFLGMPQMNFLEATAEGGTFRLANGNTVSVAGVEATGKVTIGIRPEHLRVCDGDGSGETINGKLSVVERLGSETYAYVDVPQVGSITVRAEGDFERRAGRDICIRLDLTHAHVFDANDVAIHHPPRV
ncbi:MAG: ABC transporter ATP-binding protein [Luteibacter sp.]|jgi:multiple sugar transport system ATP-binding protein|uniref:ABC transporter ATP-binding protein n=1 Tax=Rhodanobacteraceae TaxID=1775411 RepID=UPI000568EF83|nr:MULTISPECIES: ABC transporter ATP-binding protein [Rhodanobacteraceae]MDQ7996480.1 ABC transporter ATP-binding protein [Luteibacter sp.]MDQ8050158.1 ABC transporter ATP-binding protein [Luteibacter sp.]SDG95591.1 sorbitol ABC transporter ATP-binding protein /mannitol ABC transporter ATP-binding protein [Dyella sp. 333MFSha]SKB99457.1 sorbitol ABC transporter ATP-binding protein/mannitol ABC transporter ATP-binding protein [Luteibacter sp. 22Crub2.1]